uniref:30S ribosomal protein S15 n=1 Tax=Chrysotila carterae TaxID=13221 RepID=A0A7S4FAB7_CHRCT|mmetsp:Transcript_8126/g.17804  ORF Transcript_8126/g.17804 Transcript_8126/m.17804 type:complete len:196 (-) Transcript_8126:465-1052(-)
MLSYARSLLRRHILSSGAAIPRIPRFGVRALCSSTKPDQGAASPNSNKDPPKYDVIWQFRNLTDAMPEPLKKAYSRANMNQKELNQLEIHEAMHPWQLAPNDTGSTPVQIAVLTKKIEFLARHLEAHKKDPAAKRFIQMRVSERSKLLQYLRRQDRAKYEEILEKLNIRRARTFDPLVAEAKKQNKGARMLGKRR